VVWRWGKRVLFVVAGVVLLYQLWLLAHVWYWIDHNPTTTALMQSRLDALQDTKPGARLDHRWAAYERISPHLKRAVVAAEDAKFLDHDGFDWKAIQQAYAKNLEEGRTVAGGSTISQQLAKNLFLSAERTPWRKA
jgi:monofunctional biosynthetic peptidoglycan transglycosylase